MLNIKLRFLLPFILLAVFSITSCDSNSSSHTKKDNATDENPLAHVKKKADAYFTLDKITIILKEEPDLDKNKMIIQDFVVKEKSFIPIFSSMADYKKSVGSTDLGKPVIEINPYLFLSMLSGTESVRTNPGLEDDINFKASELKSIYTKEIASFKESLAK